MALPVLTVSFRPRDTGVVDEACRITAGCGSSQLLTAVAVVLVGVFLAVFLTIALDRIREARSVVERERSRASAERDAFESFADRVAKIDASPVASPQAVGGGGVDAVGLPSGDARFDRVREAYRETVMDVSHYDQEYDEPLEMNMAAELGEEVAAAVAAGDQFTPHLKSALREGSREAARRREELVSALDREAEALEEATDALEDVDEAADDASREVYATPFEELLERWHRLDDLEERCDRLLQDRQASLHDGGASPFLPDAPSLQEYLYGGLDVRYPVVSDATAVLARVREARREVLDAITRHA